MTWEADLAFLRELAGEIEPASEIDAVRATERLSRLDNPELAALPRLRPLAARLAAARRTTLVDLSRRALLVCAADHGAAGATGPTAAAGALRQIAAGRAAVSTAARAAAATVVLVDCGLRGAETLDLGRGVLSFRLGDGTADFRAGPAMERSAAAAAVRTGVALVYSLADAGLDLLALGALGAGGDDSASALIDALAPLAAGAPDPVLDAIAAVGGFETACLAGAVLGAASIRVPVVIDGVATAAAALAAARTAVAAADYAIASSAAGPAHAKALAAIGLEPLVDVGVSHGEGTAAALALPVIDAAARVLRTA